METVRAYRHYMGVLFDRGERWKVVVTMVGGILIALMDTVSVLLVAPLVLAMGDDWDTGAAATVAGTLGITTQESLVVALLSMVIGGFILKDLLTIAFQWWSLSFTTRIRARAQITMTEYYMRLPYHLHGHLSLPIIMRKASTSVMQAYSAFASGVLTLATQAFSIFSIGLALIVAAPAVTGILVVFLGVTSFAYLRLVRPINARIGREQLDQSEESFRALVNAFGAIKETQLRNAYDFFLDEFARPTTRVAVLQRNGGFINSLPKQLIEILFMVGLGLAFAVSSFLGASGSMLASLALLVAAAFRVLPTVAGLLGSLANIKQAEAGTIECCRSIIDSRRPGATMARVPHDGVVVMPMSKALVLHDVRFRYSQDGREVLQGISLDIPVGSSVAFVGSSGAGKSTLIDLVMGLQTATAGSITADGRDIATNLVGWQRNVGVVPQDVFLINGSVAENVAFDVAPSDIDEDRVRRALAQADILDFVESQPQGIWSEFGDGGRRLSGGQRQRLGIARALYRRPRILILDEATSALDNETEARIAQTINGLHEDITVIMVAHRLSTVRDADLIAYLEDGRIAAQGRFDELQERSTGFRRLVELGSLDATGAGRDQA